MDTKNLKYKILQLAIQGKLVAQDKNDELALVLLERIKEEKEQLIKNKIMKKEKALPLITDEEKIFELPRGWEWVRLGEIIQLISGRDISSSLCNDSGIGTPYIMGASNMTDGGITIERWIENPTVIGKSNDIMISVKGTVGKMTILELEEVHLSRQVMSLRCINKLSNRYVLTFLKYFINEVQNKSTGVIPGISREDILNIQSPLPPLEEQKRIVAKVDSLFKLIDELDDNKQDFLQNISDSRNKVLQLAIQGKLVSQDENDEPASLLLEKIKEEKQQLIIDKVIRKENPLKDINDEEKPFELPNGWEWCRFSEILDVRDGTHDTPKYVNTGIPLITSKNISGRGIDYSNVKYISIEDHKSISKRSKVDDGDILFAMIGSIGNPVIVNKELDFSIKNVALFKFFSSNVINNKYLYYYLLFSQNHMRNNAKGAVQSFVSLKFLREYVLALPPIEEQNRIVVKLDVIMNYFDELEKQLN